MKIEFLSYLSSVVMRRDQIHKICLNHALTADIEYKAKDQKSWQFITSNYIDGEVEAGNYCLRFKNEELAKEFKAAVDKALNGSAPEEGNNLDRLKLAADFYDYETKPECTGCRGCNPDDFVFPSYPSSVVSDALPISHPDRKPTRSAPPFKPSVFGAQPSTPFSFALNTSEASGSFFGSQATSFGLADDNKPQTASIFGGTSIFSGSSESSAITNGDNQNSSFATPVPKSDATVKPFSFSSVATPEKSVESKPLFGGLSFGSNEGAKAPTASIFGTASTESKSSTDTAQTSSFTFKLPTSTTITPVILKEPTDTTPATTPTNDKAPSSIFGTSSPGFSFADLAKSSTSAETKTEPFSFPTTNNLSFGALAQGNSNHFFGAAQDKPTPTSFVGLSNRDTFSNLMGPATNGQPKTGLNGNENGVNGDNENATDDPNYDPHYEPIIELPDEIQVSTGEENEQKLFGERAKLYRYDATNREVRFPYWQTNSQPEISHFFILFFFYSGKSVALASLRFYITLE